VKIKFGLTGVLKKSGGELSSTIDEVREVSPRSGINPFFPGGGGGDKIQRRSGQVQGPASWLDNSRMKVCKGIPDKGKCTQGGVKER